jgi:hypothetical protein
MNKDDLSVYTNTRTKQQIQLQKSIQELVKLDENETFKTTFCCALAKWLSDNHCLRELLDAISSYKWQRDKDHPRHHVGGYFDFKNKTVFFKNLHNEILIGFMNERHYMKLFQNYKYFSIESVKDF